MQGLDLHRNLYAHIAGVDLVRDGDGTYYVLEDNLRTPSGVSYMLENREIMMRMFPQLFRKNRIEPVDQYPDLLRRTLESLTADQEMSIIIVADGLEKLSKSMCESRGGTTQHETPSGETIGRT